jgi:hypothetical protein
VTIPEGFPLDDAITAHALLRPWWRALADDDDVSVRGLNHPASVGDPGPGLAARIRDILGVTAEQCASMGVFNTVSVLGDGTWAFFCKTGVRSTFERPILSRRNIATDAIGTAARGWLIRVDRTDDGSWRVWGWTPHQEAIDKVILPPRVWDAAPVRR